MKDKDISYLNFKTEERIRRLKAVLEKRQPDLTVVLENINDPHNVSAVIRTCDAVGIMDACFVYYGSQEFPELKERSSASSRKWVGQRHFNSIESCFSELKKEGKKIYTTHLAKDSVSLYDLNLTEPVALVFGNEHSGVSDKAVELADGNFLIPQAGIIQSLNISVAAAVSLYEAFRQRKSAGMYDFNRFSEKEFNLTLEDWLRR